MACDSEFRAYPYIQDVLSELGWDTRNPARSRGGSVYTQREFYRHDSLLTQALGKKAPENIIVVPWDGGPRYWIVEAKRAHRDRAKALREAQGYADKVNALEPGAARLATGIAGTPDQSFYVSTTYWDGGEWQEVSINNYETTGFLTFDQCRGILNQNSPRILHYDVDLGRFLEKANAINTSLHRNGVAARDRAKMVAGLLLVLAEDSTMRISNQPLTLVNDVNGRIESLLTQHGKEDFRAEVFLKLPNTPENHRKYWSAIVQTMQHLREMNIRSAINSGTDALGQFYETFLKYANDASEMGIVLTPRHVTQFAVDVMDIRHDDLIFDPTCGTGGFLVSALDSIRARHYGSHPEVYKAFRNDCLFGVEQADDVFGLALVNMIFRGDGKSHIHNGNCFDNRFVRVNGQVIRLKPGDRPEEPTTRPFSRVLMNPPFAIQEKEREFVNYALDQMREGGLLFAILPNAPITGGKDDSAWRREVVKRHTVRAVVKLPDDLFMPGVHKGTWALILEAWRPHRTNDQVFFGFLHDDKSASQKSKMLGAERARDNLARLADDLARFLRDGRARIEPVPQQIAIFTLNMDLNWDFASEAYLESDVPDMSTSQPVEGLFVELARRAARQPRRPSPVPQATRDFELQDLFMIRRGRCPPLKSLAHGETPVVTASEKSNGIAGYYAVPADRIGRNCITISANGSEGAGKAFWHPYPFSATADALICDWQDGWEVSPTLCLYVCNAISQNAWRFDQRIAQICRHKNRQVYWVCPIIDPSDMIEATSAQDAFHRLTQAMPDVSVGLVHGRMKGPKKEQVINDFAAGKLQILVATTVIEVGIDVPNATIIVIENAERLGLAQLHQLRGRVGRGIDESHCVLMYKEPLSPTAEMRMQAMQETLDGFKIAEKDLQMRGSGEMFGPQQSGRPVFRFADLMKESASLHKVNQIAKRIQTQDPPLANRLMDRWLPSARRIIEA